MALIRDQYVGEAMARIMSLIMGVFVLVPAIAPALGQGVMHFFHWRVIFAFLALQALVAVGWLALRQPETLGVERRRPFSLRSLYSTTKEVFSYRETVHYALGLSLVFANLVAYLTTAPLLFRDLFGVVETFPLFFSATAVAIGVGSFVNSRFVKRLGARRVCLRVLSFLCTWSGGFLLVTAIARGAPSLAAVMIYLIGAFACLGPLMGNLNALSMGPVGHIAGTAAAVIGAASTFLSLALGSLIGLLYDQTMFATVGGFCLFGALSLLVVWRGQPVPSS